MTPLLVALWALLVQSVVATMMLRRTRRSLEMLRGEVSSLLRGAEHQRKGMAALSPYRENARQDAPSSPPVPLSPPPYTRDPPRCEICFAPQEWVPCAPLCSKPETHAHARCPRCFSLSIYKKKDGTP